MKRFIFVAGGVVVFAVGLLLPLVSKAQAEYRIPAPTILKAEIRQEPLREKPLITGVTFNNTLVDIYIDDIFQGKAIVANGPQGVASFAYEPYVALAPGRHVVKAVARSYDQSVRSKESMHVPFTVPYATPAPVLLDPVVSEDGTYTIIGLAKNGLTVEIFIEGVRQVSFAPPQAGSGTTNFWYRPRLEPGEYTVTARTIDSAGKASIFSEKRVLFIPKGEEVAQEKQEKKTKALFEQPSEEAPAPAAEKESEEGGEISSEEEAVSTDEEANIVVEEPTEGEVAVVEKKEEGKVSITEGEREVAIVTPSDETSGLSEEQQIALGLMEEKSSSKDEKAENEEQIDNGAAEEVAPEENFQARQRQNRIVGLIVLSVIVIILFVWYIRERQKSAVLPKEKNRDSSDVSGGKRERKEKKTERPGKNPGEKGNNDEKLL